MNTSQNDRIEAILTAFIHATINAADGKDAADDAFAEMNKKLIALGLPYRYRRVGRVVVLYTAGGTNESK